MMWDFYWGAFGAGFQAMSSPELGAGKGVSLYLRGGATDLVFSEIVLAQTDHPAMAYGGIRFGLGVTLGPIGNLRLGVGDLGLYIEPHFELDFDSVRLVLMPIASLASEQDSFYLGGAASLEFDVSEE